MFWEEKKIRSSSDLVSITDKQEEKRRLKQTGGKKKIKK